jgi:hypothetical protein
VVSFCLACPFSVARHLVGLLLRGVREFTALKGTPAFTEM